MLKIAVWMQHPTVELWKSTSGQLQDGGGPKFSMFKSSQLSRTFDFAEILYLSAIGLQSSRND